MDIQVRSEECQTKTVGFTCDVTVKTTNEEEELGGNRMEIQVRSEECQTRTVGFACDMTVKATKEQGGTPEENRVDLGTIR